MSCHTILSPVRSKLNIISCLDRGEYATEATDNLRFTQSGTTVFMKTVTASVQHQRSGQRSLPRVVSVALVCATIACLLLINNVDLVSASKFRSWRKAPYLNPWTISASQPVGYCKIMPRKLHKMVAGADGALWVFGGQTVGGLLSNEIFKLDVETKQCTKITWPGARPSARIGHAMAHIGGHLWVHGGSTESGEGVACYTWHHQWCVSVCCFERLVTCGCHLQASNRMQVVQVSRTSCG